MCPLFFIPNINALSKHKREPKKEKERKNQNLPHTRSRPCSRPKTAVPSSREIILRLLFSPSCRTCFSTTTTCFGFFLSRSFLFWRRKWWPGINFNFWNPRYQHQENSFTPNTHNFIRVILWLDNAVTLLPLVYTHSNYYIIINNNRSTFNTKKNFI